MVVPPADIPEPLEMDGDWLVTQGDSAAYYYEYTLGSTYEWTFTGASEEQVLTIFAISLLWDSLGWQQVCVTETNQDGCQGMPVCEDVFVEDDVWSVDETASHNLISAFPNPATHELFVRVPAELQGTSFVVMDARGAHVKTGQLLGERVRLEVHDLPVGSYLLKPSKSRAVPFQVKR